MNLYKVCLHSTRLDTWYAVANDPTEAYDKVFKFLQELDWNFPRERELESVHLVASSAEAKVPPPCGVILIV